MVYDAAVMPRKTEPASDFGKRLHQLRMDRGLTQIQLAKAISSSQRAISHYETVAEFPPAPIIIALAAALRVTTDELLGAKRLKKENDSPEMRKLWRKFQAMLALPEKDQRAIIRMINSLAAARLKSASN